MLQDIITQLKSVLPKYTDDFTTNLSVTSLVRSGTTVTAETSVDHNLTASDNILITDAKTPVLIDSITRNGNYASVITNTKHSLVNGDKTTEISGADQSDYNGTKTLKWTPEIFSIASISISGTTATVTTISDHGYVADSNINVKLTGISPQSYNKTVNVLTVPTSTTFTCEIEGTDQDASNQFGKIMQVQQILNSYTLIFEVDNTPITPATGTIYQLTDYQTGYNGYKTVTTVPTTTSFTYEISETPLSPAQGTILAKSNPTIDAAPDTETISSLFTTKFTSGESDNWMYCVLGDGVTSRDRTMSTDAIAQLNIGTSTRLTMLKTFDLYVFIKTSNSNYFTDSMVKAHSYLQPLGKTLVNFKPTSPFSDGHYTGIVLTGEGFSALNSQYYVHRYSFETHNYMYNADQVNLADAVPLRNFDVDFLDKDNVIAEIRAEIDQDY